MTRVLVTGGSGFLGRHVIDALIKHDYEVVALARSHAAARVVEGHGAQAVGGDLDDPASVDAAFAAAEADVLVNLASLGFGHAPTIVSAAAEVGLVRGIYVSSTAIFTTLNAASKPRRKAGEDTVTTTDLDWTVVRPTMIYGTPGDRNLARLLQIIKKAPVLPVPGGGARLQQPVHVDDLATAIVNAIYRPATIRNAYNLAGPEAISFRALLEQCGDAVGRRPRLVPVPLGATIGAMRLYERVVPHPRLKAEQLERLSEDKAFDISDARRDLDFDPRPFHAGIESEAALFGARPIRPHQPGRPAGAPAVGPTGGANAPTLDHFDEVAGTWIGRYEERPSFKHRFEIVGGVIAGVLRDYHDPTVLDFGGGPGVFSMVATTHAHQVVCLDASEPMVLAGARHKDRLVALATRIGKPRPDSVERVVGTVESLHATPRFDVISAIAVLEYLEDPADTLSALGALLRDGGRVVFTVPNERSAFRLAEDVVGSLGVTLGRMLRSQRLQSRAYASVRPHGNQVPWRPGADAAGLTVERILPLALASSGRLSHIHATAVVVLHKVPAGDSSDTDSDDTLSDRSSRGTPNS